MSKIISVLLLFISATLASGCSAQETKSDSTNVANTTEQSVQNDSVTVKPFLVDVRTPAEFAEGSVNGAVNIPLDQVEARVAEFQGKGEIVVFCRSGNRSAQAKSILDQHGIKNVTNGGTWMEVADKYK